jgi:uncharacterized membrane protein
MESKVKIMGHPVHPMLIAFPLGLLAMAVIFDLIYLGTTVGYWSGIAYYLIAAGIIGGLVAAPFGLIDWLSIPRGTRAKSIGLFHGVGNLLALLIFALSWLIRRETIESPPSLAIILGVIGLGVMLVAGWLGGELVDRLGVGVDEGAHLNAPNSLSGHPASEDARVIHSAKQHSRHSTR